MIVHYGYECCRERVGLGDRRDESFPCRYSVWGRKRGQEIKGGEKTWYGGLGNGASGFWVSALGYRGWDIHIECGNRIRWFGKRIGAMK